MTNLSFFREHGYQVLKDVFPVDLIDEVGGFLEVEREKTLDLIRQKIPFRTADELIGAIEKIAADERAFKSLDPALAQMLSGHFSLATRLNPKLHLIPKSASVADICGQMFGAECCRMHLPPTARFVLPNNKFAAVPPHQDVSYNTQVENFFVLWVPFCKIDDECGGVVVHHGSGQLPEQIKDKERKFWLKGIAGLNHEKVHCVMDKGDALLLNKWVIHESAGNTSRRIRTSADFRFFTGPSSKHCLDMKTWQTIAPDSVE